MKNFFKPTNITWIIFFNLLAIVGVFIYFLYTSSSFAILIFAWPMLLWEWVGLPVKHSEGWPGLWISTATNSSFIFLANIFVLYVFSSFVSFLWRKKKNDNT